jgi:N6-adenosine-specific RNA methylase IME4
MLVIEPFRVVVADPAWLFGDNLPGDTRGASSQYGCMPAWDIMRLCSSPRTIMGQPIADDALLFLWRVGAMQQDALDVARSWGFNVVGDLVWLKKTTSGLRWFGMGRILRAEHEICLVCKRGHPQLKSHSVRSTFITEVAPSDIVVPPTIATDSAFREPYCQGYRHAIKDVLEVTANDVNVSGLSAKVGRHSEKPEEFYKIVEELSAGPYLELFARRRRPGWTCIGDEVDGIKVRREAEFNGVIPYYNEACASCGVPCDLHKSEKDAPSGSPHAVWGDVDACRMFTRCNPPRAAYGVLGE